MAFGILLGTRSTALMIWRFNGTHDQTHTHTHTECTELAQKQAAAGRSVLTLKSALEVHRELRESNDQKVAGSIPVITVSEAASVHSLIWEEAQKLVEIRLEA